MFPQLSKSHTSLVQAGAVSPRAYGFPTFPQVTEEEEEEGNAGDPIEGDDAIAQTNASAKALTLTDAAAATANAERSSSRASKRSKRKGRRD
jgi:hypothetical protein